MMPKHVKHCNFFFFVFLGPSPALRKPVSWTAWRRNFRHVEVILAAIRGTSTTWKLPTRLSFL